jgi:hypothetical protein
MRSARLAAEDLQYACLFETKIDLFSLEGCADYGVVGYFALQKFVCFRQAAGVVNCVDAVLLAFNTLNKYMQINISIPSKKQLLASYCEVALAPHPGNWSPSCLQSRGQDRGVYMIHQKGEFLYIGKTAGETMSFATRLRRHFQESAAQGKHTYPKLAALAPPIYVSLMSTDEIHKRITGATPVKPRRDSAAAISLMEAALILAFNPKFQQKEGLQ